MKPKEKLPFSAPLALMMLAIASSAPIAQECAIDLDAIDLNNFPPNDLLVSNDPGLFGHYFEIQPAIDAAKLTLLTKERIWIVATETPYLPFDLADEDMIIARLPVYPGQGGYVIIEPDINIDAPGINLSNLSRQTVLDGFWVRGHLGFGGVSSANASPVLQNCIIENNSTGNGGGLQATGGNPCITNSLFLNNSAFDGGGVQLFNSDAQIRHCDFIGNTADNGGGISIAAQNQHTVSIFGTTFDNNSTSNLSFGFGGGIASIGFQDLQIEQCSFKNNSSVRYGGGLALEFSEAIVNYSVFDNNHAGRQGGGIFLDDADSVLVSNSQIYGNSAANGAGVASVNQQQQNQVESINVLSNCLIVNNVADGNGGGVFVGGFEGFGGVFGDAGASVQIEYCTIDSNDAINPAGIGEGGGVFIGNSSDPALIPFYGEKIVEVNSTILHGNIAEAGSLAALQLTGSDLAASVTIESSIWQRGVGGTPYPCSACQLPAAVPGYVGGGSADPVTNHPLVNYYLSQTGGSDAIDGGDPSTFPSMPGFTSVAHDPDLGPPDIGFHYAAGISPKAGRLSADVSTIPSSGGTVLFTLETSEASGPNFDQYMVLYVSGSSGPTSGIQIPVIYGGGVLDLSYDFLTEQKFLFSPSTYSPSDLFVYDSMVDGHETISLTLSSNDVSFLMLSGVTELTHVFFVVTVDTTLSPDPSAFAFVAPSNPVTTALVP